jgi:transporter family-2 protein
MLYYGIILALAAGIFITVQGAINSMAGSTIGVFSTIIIPVWIQVILMTTVLLFSGKYMAELAAVKDHKIMILWLLGSALLGTGIMLTITMSFMNIGPLLALSLIVFSQLAVSMVIEHFGWFGTVLTPITLSKIGGLGAILLGVFLFSK